MTQSPKVKEVLKTFYLSRFIFWKMFRHKQGLKTAFPEHLACTSCRIFGHDTTKNVNHLEINNGENLYMTEENQNVKHVISVVCLVMFNDIYFGVHYNH